MVVVCQDGTKSQPRREINAHVMATATVAFCELDFVSHHGDGYHKGFPEQLVLLAMAIRVQCPIHDQFMTKPYPVNASQSLISLFVPNSNSVS